jgi:hypothetical protein
MMRTPCSTVPPIAFTPKILPFMSANLLMPLSVRTTAASS